MRNYRKLVALSVLLSSSITLGQTQEPRPPSAEERSELIAAMQRYHAMPDTPGSGPFAAMKEEDPRLPGYVIYRPRDMSRLKDKKLAVVGWGNGGCMADGASARLHLLELASHGYVAVAVGTIKSGPGAPPPSPPPPGPPKLEAQTSAEQIMAGIEWVVKENSRKGSAYYRRIDSRKIAVSGTSCGGLQALQLAGDPRVKAVVAHNTGIFPDGTAPIRHLSVTKSLLDKLHTPVIYIQGGPSDIAYPNGMDDFNRITKVPVAMLNANVGHGGTFMEPNGGSGARVAVAWLEWQLRRDKNAAAKFVGTNCGLCNDKYWTIERRNFPVK